MVVNSINNNGQPYYFPADIAKEGDETVSISNYLKMRVHDNGKILPVKWYDQGRVMNVNGMIPYIEGWVGPFTTDENSNIAPAGDVVYRSWQGTTANTHDGGWADYILTDQMFVQEGIFYGKIGLKNGNGMRLSSVNVWFKVLGDDLFMAETTKYYDSEIEKLINNFKNQTKQVIDSSNGQVSQLISNANGRVDQLIQDARNTYNSHVQNSKDVVDALDREVKANRAELGNINHQLEGTEQQIAIHDIVTIPEHQRDIKAISEAIDQRLANVKTAPVAVENAQALQEQYPHGADGIFVTADTGHKWLWLTGSWTDCGEYQAIGIGDDLLRPIKEKQAKDEQNINTNKQNISANISQIKRNQTNIESVKGAGRLTTVHITDQQGNYITDQYGNRITGDKWLIMVDKTLTQSDMPADAEAVGHAIKEATTLKPEKYGIPVLYLYGDKITSLKDKSKTLKNEVTYKFPKYHVQGTVKKFKVQGASSATLPKKNYTLNLDQDFVVFSNYGKQHKYVIKANMTDFSQARNVVNAKIWGKVRADHLNVSDALQDTSGNYLTDSNGNHILGMTDPQLSVGGTYGAVDGFPIAVYVNDKYWGLYSFNIPKDDWMAKMPSKAGYAIVDTVWTPQGAFTKKTNFKDSMELQFCGTKDTKWAMDSINKLIDAAIAHYDTKDAFDKAILPLLDMDSAVDYFIYSLLIGNVDGVYRNYLLQTFNGTKWYFAAYDLDETYGRTPQSSTYYLLPNKEGTNLYKDGITVDTITANNRLFYQLWKFYSDEIKSRMADLVKNSLSAEQVDNEFINYSIKIPAALKNEEVKIWKGTPETSVNNIDQIGRWYMQRIKFINEKYLSKQA